MCSKVLVTVTMDVQEPFMGKEKSHQLFYMSHKMIRGLCELTKETEEPVWIKAGEKSRFAHSPALSFMEKNLFRYRRQVYKQEQKEISIFSAGTPLKEMEETARRILRLVRKEGYRFGEIAVITGNLRNMEIWPDRPLIIVEFPVLLMRSTPFL